MQKVDTVQRLLGERTWVDLRSLLVRMEGLTNIELKQYAADLGIALRFGMSREQIVRAIAEVESGPVEELRKQEFVAAKTEFEAIRRQNQTAGSTTLFYVENAQIGAMVAFKTPSGRVKSAKVINKSTKRRLLKLETEYGQVFEVPYVDVLWVRRGNKWPTGIWRLLKGLGESQ